MLEVRCLFLGQYHAKYQRNNKRCGFKNLRCFPHCGPNNVHHEQGFCGAPISMDVAVVGGECSNSSMFELEKLRAWGEFALRDAAPRFPVGSIFTKHDIAPLLRSDAERSNPLFEASLDVGEESTTPAAAVSNKYNIVVDENGSKKRRFSFHSHKMGYHYGWVGNKHSSNQCHAFCTYVAVELSPGRFQCIGVFHSSPFTIFCRRRHKTVSKEEKDQLAEPLEEYVVRHRLNESGAIPASSQLINLTFYDRPCCSTKRKSTSTAGAAATTSEESDTYSDSDDSDDTEPPAKLAHPSRRYKHNLTPPLNSNKRSRITSDVTLEGCSPRGVAPTQLASSSGPVQPLTKSPPSKKPTPVDCFLQNPLARLVVVALSSNASSKSLDFGWMLGRKDPHPSARSLIDSFSSLTEDDELLDEIIFESEECERPREQKAGDRKTENMKERFLADDTFAKRLDICLKDNAFDTFMQLVIERCRVCDDLEVIHQGAMEVLDEAQLRIAFSSLVAQFDETQLTAASCSVSPSSSCDMELNLLGVEELPEPESRPGRKTSIDGFMLCHAMDMLTGEELQMMNKVMDLTELFGPSLEPLNDEGLLDL